MKKVQLVKNNACEYISIFENSVNKNFGFLKVSGTINMFRGSTGRSRTIFCQIKGTKDFLENLLAEAETGIDKTGKETKYLNGQIQVREYLESEIPADVLREYISANVLNGDSETYEKVISQYQKRMVCGEDIMPYHFDGEQIYEFFAYEPDGQKHIVHTLQPHTNGDELKQFLADHPKAAHLPVNNEPDAKEITGSIKANAKKSLIK